MAERQPIPAEARRQKIANTINRLTSYVSPNIGTSNYAERADFDIGRYSGVEQIATKIKVAEIRQAIDQKTIPSLNQIRNRLEAEVSLEQNLSKMEDLVAGGYLEQSDLDEARRIVSEQKESEGEQPKLVLDVENYEVSSVTGSGVYSVAYPARHPEFRAIVYLANRAPNRVSPREIAKAAGSGQAARFVVTRLRRDLEPDSANPQIILHEGVSKDRKYWLNAQVEFVGESQWSKRSREGAEVYQVSLPDGQIIRVKGKILAAVIRNLLKTSAANPVETDDLATSVYGTYDSSTRAYISNRVRIARKLLADYGYTVEQPVDFAQRKTGQKAKYYLVKIEDETPKEKTPKEVPPPVHETRLAALDLIVSDEKATSDQIIKTLGPSRAGKPLHRGNAQGALFKAANLLLVRAGRGNINKQEQETFDRINEYAGGDVRRAFREFRSWAISRVLEGPSEFPSKGQIEVTKKEMPQLSRDEILVLTRLLTSMEGEDILKDHGLDAFPQENAKEIITTLSAEMTQEASIHPEQIEGIRKRALDKIWKLLKESNLNEIFDQQVPQTQDLLIYFFVAAGEEPKAKLLEELFRAPIESFWQTKGGNVIRYWRDAVLNGEPQKTTNEEKPKKPSALEKTDPKVRERIASIIATIDKRKLPWPMSVPQVNRLFLRLKQSTLVQAEERGYVNPAKGRDGRHPRYSKAEVTLLLYLDQMGNSLRSRQLKELKRIIAEEVAKGSSGKK